MITRTLTGIALVAAAGFLGSWFVVCGGTADAADKDDVGPKLHALVDQLTPEQQAALLLLLSDLTAKSGQAEAAAQDPLGIAKEGMAAFAEAAKKGDIDAMMANISDDFNHYQLGDKEGLRGFLQNAAAMGYLDELEISLEDTEVEKDGDLIVLYPVEVEGAFGTAVFEFEAKQKGGKWVISGLDASGI